MTKLIWFWWFWARNINIWWKNYQSHTIKSTVRTVGILELAKIASEIEIESDKDNPDLAFILGHFEEFKQKSQNELPRLKDEMEMLLSDKTCR